jgi:hypothetical protein
MKHRSWLLAALLLGLPVAASAQEAYAPLIEIPSASADDPELQIEILMIKQSQVPPRDAVEQPPYPGALVIQSLPASRMEVNGEMMEMLPTIRLLSTDTPDQVLAFYQEKLPDWKLTKAWGMMPVLYVGEGDWEPFTASEASYPSVAIGELMDGHFKLMPDAKTEITIRYER